MTIQLPYIIAEGDTTNADKIQANFSEIKNVIETITSDIVYADTRFKVSNFQPNQTSLGDVSYTGVGFKPSAILFFSKPAAANNSTYASWGFSSGGTDRALIAKSNIQELAANSIFTGDGNSWDVRGTIKSFDTDGFTITWTKTGTPPAGLMNIAYLAIR